ncbi:MAG: methionine adenosyltransferase [Zestosphaera sp.]
MMRNIEVELADSTPAGGWRVELVERKGLGHPDYIADAASEVSSVSLSKYYLENYNMILHHNVDKALVVGGQSKPRFGGGEVLHPIYIIVAGRATEFVRLSDDRSDRVPVGTLVVDAVKKWISQNFRFLDPERHVVVDYMIRPGSADLVRTFEAGLKGERRPLANDTSVGVGYAPLTALERIVLGVEKYLNSREFKERLPEVGEDIKVMGLRVGSEIKLTIAAAMISHLIPDLNHYISVKEELRNVVEDFAANELSKDERLLKHSVEITVNSADVITEDERKSNVYLTVTGTSAEHGDDGMTGRGNRVNGLITPMRPMSLEATAGKNAVTHVGKIYNVLASKMASRIVSEVPKVKEVYVKLLSKIGHPIDEPQMVLVRLMPTERDAFNTVKSDVLEIINEELDKIVSIANEVISGKVMLF